MKKPLTIILRIAIPAVLVIALTVVLYRDHIAKQPLDIKANLDEKVFTIDGEDLTLRDFAFYIIYEEYNVEKDAMIYNRDNTRDYWNVHTNGYFISGLAKHAAEGMAVHDRIFYKAAVDEAMVLSADEKKSLENARTDFWEDLFESQKENLIAPVEDINRTMYEIALAEKYQRELAKKLGTTYHALDWNGEDFEEIKKAHDIKSNERIRRKITLGNITLVHGPADFTPYINRDEDGNIIKKEK